jgi:hypothetical protein
MCREECPRRDDEAEIVRVEGPLVSVEEVLEGALAARDQLDDDLGSGRIGGGGVRGEEKGWFVHCDQ